MTGSQKRPHGRLKVEPATSLNILSQFLYLIHHHGNVMSNETSCFDYGFLFISFHRVAKETLLYIYIYIYDVSPSAPGSGPCTSLLCQPADSGS